MDGVQVKLEPFDTSNPRQPKTRYDAASIQASDVIELSSSSSESDCDGLNDIIDSIIGGKRTSIINVDEEALSVLSKRRRLEEKKPSVVVPVGFLDSLPPIDKSPPPSTVVSTGANYNKQFWKAGDYEGAGDWDPTSTSDGIDRVRVHPKFLHSNATSHKWALGAFAELLDNALDEVYTGATYANIDMLQNEKDGNVMLLIEDNGGGMDPDKMRQCMSLGYSVKSKIANTIGQYGNGFKTSTMRLGADVIVFSRCHNKGEKSPTQSIGLLSYTFLRSTAKEDIVVPMLDYERKKGGWNKILRSSPGDWNKNVATIVQWSPFRNETDLLRQFNMMKDHGTRIIIYNLWEDDQGMLELDFDNDKNDIMLRGVNRDEKNIQMATQFPNSRHFLTYKHSLRSYASILYLRLAPGFRIILRGEDVEHHNIVNDMMLSQEVTYRPQPGSEGVPKDINCVYQMLATVTIGFVKDAKHHIDVQGFNVYHKNRLIKPFWRLWNVTGSDGRGVIGVLEANFVEPAHDKQGFERTTVLSRLEAKLIQMQKNYWNTNCHKIGYAARRNKKEINASHRENSIGKSCKSSDDKFEYGPVSSKKNNGLKSSGKRSSLSQTWSPSSEDNSDEEVQVSNAHRRMNGSKQNGTKKTRPSSNLESSEACLDGKSGGMHIQAWNSSQSKDEFFNRSIHSIDQLREENSELRKRLKGKEDQSKDMLLDVQREREGCKALETQIHVAKQKIEEMNMEQESLIDIFSEERSRRDVEEENLRKKLKDASNTIQELLDKVRR